VSLRTTSWWKPGDPVYDLAKELGLVEEMEQDPNPFDLSHLPRIPKDEVLGRSFVTVAPGRKRPEISDEELRAKWTEELRQQHGDQWVEEHSGLLDAQWELVK